MYLKSLTMKGFKSFADPTTLDLEPGVTVVVGPNGSGKSNVVDAVAWVLGAQGPRVVRSTKMDDVIFAGTDGPNKRAPLGRAEVSLVIDNGSRRLPIDFSEVTIKRTLFRSGESEYAINDVPCRLLDVQELLSDTGVGRQQHVIVGQGQLGAILEARPEERRMVIEEAAGVLKFRRRRERAVRRLDSSESALMRLQDLLREVRRQLRPLERQAASAFRYEELDVELRALRLHLSGKEVSALERQIAETTAMVDLLHGQESQLQGVSDETEAAIETGEDELGRSLVEELAPMVGRFDQLLERTKGMLALISERRRAGAELTAALDDVAGLVALEDSLVRLDADLSRTEKEAVELGPEWDRLAVTEAALVEAEVAHAEIYSDVVPAQIIEAAAAVRSETTSALEELASTRERHARLSERLETLKRQSDALVEEIASLTESVGAERFEQVAATMTREAIEQELERVEASYREMERQKNEATERLHGLAGRVEALSTALDETRARAGVERLESVSGVLGTLADLVRVEDRDALAFEAALAGTLDSAVVDSPTSARAALLHLRELKESGSLLVTPESQPSGERAETPSGLVVLRELVEAENTLVATLLDSLLADVYLCEAGFDQAVDLSLVNPAAVIVTREGDRFSRLGWRIGAGRSGVTRQVLERALELKSATEIEVERRNVAFEELRVQRETLVLRQRESVRNLDRLNDSVRSFEARHSLVISQLEERGAQVRVTQGEIAEIDVEAARVGDRVASSQRQLELFETEESAVRERAATAADARRDLESRARAVGALRRDLEVRAAGLEERRRLLIERRAELDTEIAERRESRLRAQERHGDFAIEELAYEALGRELERIASTLATQAKEIAAERTQRIEQTRALREHLSALRGERERALVERDRVRDRRQALEIEQAERRIRHENAIELLNNELGATLEEALSAKLPELAPGVDPGERRELLERELASLGPVNPLAREELLVLEARNSFLETQLEDVRSARRELNQVIRVIDAEIVDVFSRAFADVQHHYGELIASLFPGGSGQLVLTAPDDLLTTGIEIEARPAGRNIRRLSLLSGGERSLVAVAFLFAVFRSRPSPFYLMDEVEAALDEPNLFRFLKLVDEFRSEAQLIIVSHQKKTMEYADALYGVTMQPGGASRVVSERVRKSGPTPSSVAADSNEGAGHNVELR